MLVLAYPQTKREPQLDPSPTEDLGGQQTYPKSVPTLLRERMVRF